MSKQEDFRRPEKPLEKTREIDNEARISKKAEMKRKPNRNQKRITLRGIQLSSLTFLVLQFFCNILMTFLMMLSVALISLLMILLSNL